MVRFPDEVDIACAPGLRERMLVLLNRGTGTLVADLRDTTFCDCAGLNVILRARIRAEALGTPFGVLLRPSGLVWKVFVLAGVSEIIPHAPTMVGLVEAIRVHREASRYGPRVMWPEQ